MGLGGSFSAVAGGTPGVVRRGRVAAGSACHLDACRYGDRAGRDAVTDGCCRCDNHARPHGHPRGHSNAAADSHGRGRAHTHGQAHDTGYTVAAPLRRACHRYTELTLGEPRYQPPGYALFSTLRACFWNCGGERVGVVRTVFDGQSGELLVDDPLASLDEFGRYLDFEMHDGGELMAATFCLRGYCGGLNAPSDDARQEIWVSSDGGETWTGWGALEPPSWLLRVTEDDVAVEEEVKVWGGGRSAVRWIKSGKVFPEPASENPRQVGVVAWDGDVPIWGEWGASPQPAALAEVVKWTWRDLHARPGGSNVWWAREPGGPLLLLAVLDPEGVVEEVYGWPSADYVDRLVPIGDGLFAGFRIEGGYAIGRDHLNFLIDLEAGTVHPLLGLPDGEPGFAEPWRAVPLAAD